MATYYKVCPLCGATLDSGEVCDCLDEPHEASPSGRRAEYMDASTPTALAVCKGCRSKRYCTSPCAAAEDEMAERRHAR